MLDTVLLELEGVIADTGEARHDAIVAALHADGVNLPENDYRDLCAGLSFEETADVLGISVPTANRDWAYARAWLHQEIGGNDYP